VTVEGRKKAHPTREGAEVRRGGSCTRLDEWIEALPGVGPKTGALFRSRGFERVRDLLWLLPARYEDRRFDQHIRAMVPGQRVQGKAAVKATRLRYAAKVGRWIYEVTLNDTTGELTAKWFLRSKARRPSFRVGQGMAFAGRLREFMGHLEIYHPDVEIVDPSGQCLKRFGRILPVYPRVEGIHGKTLQRIMRAALACADSMGDPLPFEIRMQHMFPALDDALKLVHVPEDIEDASVLGTTSYLPFRRLVFDEFFCLQMAMHLRRRAHQKSLANPFAIPAGVLDRWKEELPFRLTLEQEKVVEEIREDLGQSCPMSRLLHGEVGSGKTILALLAAAIVGLHGKQTVFLVPTELLAFQVERMAADLREILNLRPLRLSGGVPDRARKEVLKKIERGEVNLVIGTHAVLEKEVTFSGVGLVVVDEQHRFGVMQKATLQDKAHWPHILIMSATPIPRTLALTLYGDLEMSTLRHPLPGRRSVSTVAVPPEERQMVYDAVGKEIEEGGSVYWVVPRIGMGEGRGLKNVEEIFRELTSGVFPGVAIACIHSNVPSDEKQEILEGFQKGEYRILIATTVVEVGLDAPEATLIVVEHPELYGLAQLHQLRGRVGRGSRPGGCYLILSEMSTPLAQERLEIFQRTRDGFRLAEEDLRLRGPGEFMGTRQSGVSGFRIADISSHREVLEQARLEVVRLLQEDPDFQRPEHHRFLQYLKEYYGPQLALSRVY